MKSILLKKETLLQNYLIIAAGAILGALSRYGLGEWAKAQFGDSFVIGTLLINLIGSFLLGLFLTLRLDRGFFTPAVHLFIAVGWCASFTTYSTFSWDTYRYIQEGNFRLAFFNIGLTLLGCLAATWAGAVAGRLL
jgi:CrcB protein